MNDSGHVLQSVSPSPPVVEGKLKQQLHRLALLRSEGISRRHHVKIYDKLKAKRQETLERRTALHDVIKNIQVFGMR